MLTAATLTSGLLAGLFLAFSVAVMPGLHRGDDTTLVLAMTQVNEAILNPWFLLTFVGAPALSVAAVVTEGAAGADRGWTVAAVALHAVTLLVTTAVNVPLNDALAAASGDAAGARAAFEAPWVAWNLVRTVSSTGAFGCLVVALGR